jgi:RNA polymerase sigma-70 factor (ECF subfamily)
VDRHLPTVLAIARRMLKDDAEAEDVAQRHCSGSRRNAAASSWVPVACGPGCGGWPRTCASTGRSRRNTTAVDQVPEQAEPASQVRHLVERELGARVDAALKALPGGKGWRLPSSTTRA